MSYSFSQFIPRLSASNALSFWLFSKTARGKPYPVQVKTISSLLSNWRQCQYPQDSSYVSLALELAKAQFKTGEVGLAINQVKEILKFYAAKNQPLRAEDQVKAYYRLGFYWKQINEYKQASAALEEAVKIGGKLPDNEWTAYAYATLAYVNYSIGEYPKVVQYADEGMTYALRIKNNIAYYENCAEKIKGLIALGKDNEAESELARCIALARTDADASYDLAIFLVRRAKIDEKKNHIQRAIAAYQEALRINKSDKYEAALIDNYIDLGYLFYRQNNDNEALACYRKGLQIVSDPYTKLRLLNNVGLVFRRKKDYATALAYYQAGLNALPFGLSSKQITVLPRAELIRIASQKEYFLTLIQDKADTWLDYAKATNNKQRLRYALDTYKVADQMIDFMRWEHTGQRSKIYWRQKTRGMYERAIETCYLLNDAEEAFRFLEKSRAVMLADKLNELGARQQLTPDQATQEQLLQKTVSDQQRKLAGLSPDSARYESARSALQLKQDSLYDFLQQLEASNPAYYRYKYDNTTPSLSALQRYLKKQQTSLITYFVGDSALYVLGVMADSVRLKKRPIGRYSLAVSQFARLLANPEAMSKLSNVKRFLTLSHDLYQQLLAPLALPKGRVVVSPDGFFIPFDALSRSETQADYAVTNYAFSYAYSASLLLKNAARPAQLPRLRTGGFLGVAPVDFAPSLKQVTLPGSDNALKSIAERFESPMLLTHKAATRRAFQQDAPDYSVVLLFTHATADSTDQEPMLYFADSTLRLSDLSDGALPNAQLVVLAACKTGIGANQQGEGVFSLARGFSALGVPSVLTTLWSVENEATYQLTALFYKYLDDGLPKDIALQRAKQDWLKTADGANQLPNYWAGLIIVGDTEPLARSSNWLWVGGGLILLISSGIGFWVRKKRRATPSASFLRPV